jgi:hypothetical protein
MYVNDIIRTNLAIMSLNWSNKELCLLHYCLKKIKLREHVTSIEQNKASVTLVNIVSD